MSPVLIRPRAVTSPIALWPDDRRRSRRGATSRDGTHLIGDRLSFVSELTVVNPTVYEINVELTGDGRGRLNLGTVRREQAWTFGQVIDQGTTWVFRFSYGGVGGGELSLTRSQLSADGWRVTVPDDVGERLRLAGPQPSAP